MISRTLSLLIPKKPPFQWSSLNSVWHVRNRFLVSENHLFCNYRLLYSKVTNQKYQLIWFQLVDQTGRPYQGTSPTSILRDSLAVPIVDRFRKAVHAECCHTLKNIDAFKLTIFKNEKDLNENRPLPVNARISDEEMMLLVLVPHDTADVCVSSISGNSMICFGEAPRPRKQRKINVKKLKRPDEIQLELTEENPPPFTAPENWLRNIVGEIEYRMKEMDTTGTCVPPMAFMRCTRGGKTRVLLEIGLELKRKMPNAAIIYISFNDQTELLKEEQCDPIAAICRRIAFAALREPRSTFTFQNLHLATDDLLDWLGNTPCVLLIDEMNLLTSMDISFATFLKSTFLSRENRYLVFSSHTVTAAKQLDGHMEPMSDRQVLAPQLPIVPSLSIARQNLQSDLTWGQLLYYGCIPGLIVNALRPSSRSVKRLAIFDQCIEQKLVDDTMLRRLCANFISGHDQYVPTLLLPLMDSFVSGDRLKVKWIPCHMFEALEHFVQHGHVSDDIALIMEQICELFADYTNAKGTSDAGWESLFVLTLLIRGVSRNFETILLPFRSANCKVSYNSLLARSSSDFENIANVNDLIQRIPASKSGTKNHLAIYHPKNAKFETYNVISAFYNETGTRALYGYQMKEEVAVSSSESDRNINRQFLVRHIISQNITQSNWHVASDAEIETFFGVSGQDWTLKSLSRLRN